MAHHQRQLAGFIGIFSWAVKVLIAIDLVGGKIQPEFTSIFVR
jgi:hypothetical protein